MIDVSYQSELQRVALIIFSYDAVLLVTVDEQLGSQGRLAGTFLCRRQQGTRSKQDEEFFAFLRLHIFMGNDGVARRLTANSFHICVVVLGQRLSTHLEAHFET